MLPDSVSELVSPETDFTQTAADPVSFRRPPNALQRLVLEFRQLPQDYRRLIVTVLISVALHAAVLLVLAFLEMVPRLTHEKFVLAVSPFDSDDPIDRAAPVEVVVPPETLVAGPTNNTASQIDATLALQNPSRANAAFNEEDLMAPIENLEFAATFKTLKGDLGGRSQKGRLAAIRVSGGTADSERAVNAGLKWLASVQQDDGSWNFAKIGEARNPGYLSTCEMGATSMALLCYLGAGHTHATETEYQETVTNGLRYLIANARTISDEADLRGTIVSTEGMYVQGLATIALCEAFAMTRKKNPDKALKKTAQGGVNFIATAQNREGGGWRYAPGDAGDTSVVGWQIMALKSAKAGRLRVPMRVLPRARRFLQRVGANGGAFYGYTTSGKRPGTTAVGLLCRMYLGWKPDKPELADGVAYLSRIGPSRDDMYYNYYATQVLHHWGGEEWKKWNNVMRPQLVTSQVRKGPAAGSWTPAGRHSRAGGRIYETAMSIMTLEVYYRHLPLYRKEAVASNGDED